MLAFRKILRTNLMDDPEKYYGSQNWGLRILNICSTDAVPELIEHGTNRTYIFWFHIIAFGQKMNTFVNCCNSHCRIWETFYQQFNWSPWTHLFVWKFYSDLDDNKKKKIPYKHTTCIPRWNNVKTVVSTSFQRGIHVVFY